MKALKTASLEATKQPDPVKATIQKEQTRAEQMVAKSHTFRQADIDYINAMALRLGQQQNKVVGASEALRIIIEQHQEASS